MEHLGGSTSEPADTDEALARWARHWDEHGFGIVGVEERETGLLVGRTGVSFHRVWPDDPEVGWAVDPARWGEGIAVEAGGACVEWAFGELGFTRVVSITTEANRASRRVMAKLGFELLTRLVDPKNNWELWVHKQEAPLD
jgi:RimJ/RimL family protein N-acetyltransferase